MATQCKFNQPQLIRKKMDGRYLVFSALVGSHNYNLNTESSDEDFKHFVMPTFDDLYQRKIVSGSSASEELDYGLHDIRHLAHCIWKANINFVEPLFSVRQDYAPTALILWMIAKREEFARMNLPGMFDTCVGMCAIRKAQAIKNNKPGKNLSHAIRSLDFLIRYAETGFADYHKAIWYKDDDPMNSYLKELKLRDPVAADYNKLEMIGSLAGAFKKAYKSHEPDIDLLQCLNDQIYNLVREQAIRNECGLK